MKTLALSNNVLKGQISSWLWNLPMLEETDLSHNQLEGPVPPQLYNSSTSLKEVELRGNQLNDSLPNLSSTVVVFPSELDLSINNINGSVPQEFCRMLHASNFLSLTSNKLEILACVCEQTEHLEVLDLSDNLLSGKLPSHLGDFSFIKVLNLAHNKFHGQIQMELEKLKKLQVLHINSNKLSGIIPESLQNCKNKKFWI